MECDLQAGLLDSVDSDTAEPSITLVGGEYVALDYGVAVSDLDLRPCPTYNDTSNCRAVALDPEEGDVTPYMVYSQVRSGRVVNLFFCF